MHQRRQTNSVMSEALDSGEIERIPSHPYKHGFKTAASGKQLCQQGHRVLMIGLLIFGVYPLIIYYSNWVRYQLIFAPFINWPLPSSLSFPQNFSLNCTFNHFLDVQEGVTLGIWHILPQSRLKDCEKGIVLKDEFQDERPVFLYLHGVAENRGASHRLNIYNVLSQSHVDGHVVTFDYRGFGDSFGTTTTVGMINDTEAVYQWVRKFVGKERIIIWGHFVGAAVGIRLAEKLSKNKEYPAGIVLEASFSSLDDVIVTHPAFFFLRFLPYFETLIIEVFRYEEKFLNPKDQTGIVKSPILFLHSHSDKMVPLSVGKEFYKKTIEEKPDHFTSSVQFVGIDKTGSYKCGHRWLSLDPKLPDVVEAFLETIYVRNKEKN
ncbi:lysophosphatidylserine lipase ABHD12-like [Tachypleus tridentatus]|uniref:lysophosphatidylserine lipase ABHD12-like n=1 Tax=Tachypleus tridentatus TaxID=6853 RepID=UPI003FD3C450